MTRRARGPRVMWRGERRSARRLALALGLCLGLAARARAETAVLLPASGDEALRGEQQQAVRVISQALGLEGVQLLSHADALEQAGSRELSECKTIDCAPKLLRAIGADVAAAIAVWSGGADERRVVFVTLVDRHGDRYPGKASVSGRALGAAARDALVDARALQHLGPGPWLRVRTKPDGAQVLLGGKIVGATPYRAHVTSGRHVLEVRAEGRESHVQTVDVPPNSTKQVEVEVDLAPRTNTADAPDQTATALDAEAREPPIDRSPPIVGPVILGVLGAGLVATDIVLVAGSGCEREDGAGVCTRRAKIDTAWTIAWGATGVAAIAGGVLWYLLGSSDEPVSVSADSRQVIVSGSF